MAKTGAPELLTTHGYVVETAELLEETRSHVVTHQVTSLELPPTRDIDVPHFIEAKMEIPIRLTEKQDKVVHDGPQSLTMTVWSAPSEKAGVPPFSPGSITRKLPDGRAQAQLGVAALSFNSRRVFDTFRVVTPDGEQAGMTDSTAQDVILTRLSSMAGSRIRRVQKIGHFIEEVSLFAGGSREIRQTAIDFRRQAKLIEETSGLKVPKGLQSPPQVTASHVASLHREQDAPRIFWNHFLIDDYDRVEGTRSLVHYVMTQYMGWAPAFTPETDHLAYYNVSTLNGEETGTSFGIDVYTQPLTAAEDYVYAKDPVEARAMISGLVRAMTNLRRYSTSAAKYYAEQLAS